MPSATLDCASEETMFNRLSIILYGLAALWLFLAWQYVSTMMGPGQDDMTLFIGLPPLLLVVLIRFLVRGSF